MGSKKALKNAEEGCEVEDKFTLRHLRYFLTYKTHIDKDKLREKLAKLGEIKEFHAAHETGTKKIPYEHTHACVWYTKSLDYRRGATHMMCFGKDPDNKSECGKIHPNIRWIRTGKSNWHRVWSYISKEDKSDEAPEEPPETTIQEWVDEHDTLKSMVGTTGKKHIKSVPGMVMAYGICRQPECEPEPLTEPWQIQLMELMPTFAKRKVPWIHDAKGNSGKTDFVRHCSLTHPKDFSFCNSSMNMKDYAEYVKGRLMQGWSGKYMLFDLPRTTESCIGLYGAIEDTKNGMISSQKWAGAQLVFKRSTVVCFANWWPDFRKLSLDRWICYDLKNGVLQRVKLRVAMAEREVELEAEDSEESSFEDSFSETETVRDLAHLESIKIQMQTQTKVESLQ